MLFLLGILDKGQFVIFFDYPLSLIMLNFNAKIANILTANCFRLVKAFDSVEPLISLSKEHDYFNHDNLRTISFF